MQGGQRESMSSGSDGQVMQNCTRFFLAFGSSLNWSTKYIHFCGGWSAVLHVRSIYQTSQIVGEIFDLLAARIWKRWYSIPSAIDSVSGQSKHDMLTRTACYLS